MSSINFQNPPGIIDGPRKRQPSKRVTENGDHHTNKKAKTTEAIKILLKVSTVSNNSRRASVQDIPGRQVLPFVCSRLSAQSTRALMCVGSWSLLGLIKDSDIKAALGLDLVNGQEEELAAGWDSITKE